MKFGAGSRLDPRKVQVNTGQGWSRGQLCWAWAVPGAARLALGRPGQGSAQSGRLERKVFVVAKFTPVLAFGGHKQRTIADRICRWSSGSSWQDLVLLIPTAPQSLRQLHG